MFIVVDVVCYMLFEYFCFGYCYYDVLLFCLCVGVLLIVLVVKGEYCIHYVYSYGLWLVLWCVG